MPSWATVACTSGWSRCHHVQVQAVSSGVTASGSSRCRIPLLRGGVYWLPPHIVRNPRAASSRNSESDPSSEYSCTHRTLRGFVTVLPSPNESAQHRSSARYIPAAASLGLWIRQSPPMEEHGDGPGETDGSETRQPLAHRGRQRG